MKTITVSQLRHHWKLYLLLLPTMAFVLTFSYFPAVSGVYHSVFRWNGDDIAEYVGAANFRRAFTDPELVKAFGIVMIFIAANLVKMIPSIITAVVIHRMVSERARYLYRVAFVIPMVIPAMVWLLVWKYFYDPNYGVLNAILNGTGFIRVLGWLDGAMPRLADWAAPLHTHAIDPVFGSVWGLGLAGVVVLGFAAGIGAFFKRYLLLALLGPVALVIFGAVGFDASMTPFLYGPGILRTTGILAVSGAVVHGIRMRGGLWRGDIIGWLGGSMIVLAAILILLSKTWTEPTGAFATDSPSWLGHSKLIVPSLVFWGFPWVGVVSVLLYLSGLNNIDQSTYEAADLDGCSWFGKFTRIELPLIMTQVRLNLVLMVIMTLKSWGQVFIILGDGGGPDGAAMLPGLYMFRKAFRDMEAGYACAIGLLLFGLILVLTLINNRYIRVEK
ncbi:MAG: carbohydrate ABC transporter permease [Planctomycetota bacterium]